MKCLHCQAMIEDDSFYCDQCGEEIKICPQCGNQGKGKRCTNDGKVLVAAKDKDSVSADSPDPTLASVSSGRLPQGGSPVPDTGNTVSKDSSTGTPTAGGGAELKLVIRSTGQEINVSGTVTIGRTNGELAHIFGNFPTVSSTHAAINNTGGQWSVTDLGSTNGTYINNQPIVPQQPQPLSNGMIIAFGDAECQVKLPQAAAPGTVRL